MFIYTRADLKSRINAKIQNRGGLLLSLEDLVNEAVRTVNTDVDLRSMRRKQPLAPNLFHGKNEYECPADFSAGGIIDVPQQAKRSDGSFFFVPTEEFYVKREQGALSLDNYNGINTLLINSDVPDVHTVISDLDSLSSGGGNWVTYGDATNIRFDIDDYFKGNASLEFDMNAGGTTAGIENDALNIFDITDYLSGDSAIFGMAKINVLDGITGYTVQIGDNPSNYYTKTVTVRNDGTPLQSGWNLVRFDLTGLTTVGAPTKVSTQFCRIFAVKTAGKAADTGFKLDYIVIKRGKNADFKYYSNYGWNNVAGVYIENSTDDSDVLVCSNDEFQLFILKGKELGLDEVQDPQAAVTAAQTDYNNAVKAYQMQNPSEAKIQTSSYYDYMNQAPNGSDPVNYWPGRR
jgi:hypothetical protein